jgi:uncharacterized protein YrrD
MLRRAKHLKGYHLGAMDGEIGRVKEFFFDDQTWHVRYLVADTGKWLPHRKVLISPHAFSSIDDAEKLVHVQLTREQVEKSPSIDSDKPVSRQFEEEYLRYFGWPFYWSDPLMWGVPVVPPALPIGEEEPGEHHDPHLRSMSEVIGYHIEARDGEVGHVEDFLLDDSDWAITELIVDTRNWLPGKHVLVSPDFIRNVSWEQAKVTVKLDRQSLEECPEIDDRNDDAQRQVMRAYGEQMAYLP